MRERSKKFEGTGTYILGVNSKFGEFIFRHPWYSMIILLILIGGLCLILDKGGDKSLLTIQILVPIFVITTAGMRFFHRNSCYKVAIDKEHDIIKLFLMFNQHVIETRMNNIKILIDRNINCIIDERKFLIMNHLLHDLISLLPEKTDIEFVGFFGRQMEKELRKSNIKHR